MQINKIEYNKTVEIINKIKNDLFKKMNKTDKLLTRLIQKIRRLNYLKIRNKRVDITTSFT